MENESKKYVLAMYDVRGKQEYIFRNNHIKEIVGASAIIRELFDDYLFDAVTKVRNKLNSQISEELPALYSYKRQNINESFSTSSFIERIASGQYLGEVVYDGGGNFFVIYKNEEVCISINKIFTRKVLENTYSLKVLCTYIEIDNFDDFPNDRKKLYEKHRIIEARESVSIPAQVLPITKVDYQTSMPLYSNLIIAENSGKKVEREITKESYAKYKKYEEIYKDNRSSFGEVFLDNLVKKKGEDSHLAIIYIDGNQMGAKVQACISGKQRYDECVTSLRKFSNDIQKDYVDDRKKDIEEYLHSKYSDENKSRFVVFAGDEINFICNAYDAYDVVKIYFEGLKDKGSACAGISIFHSHAPYYEAYRIAEECCESGKSKMKEMKLDEANFIDFHYCQSGIGIDLESIREFETNNNISRPWYVSDVKDNQCNCTKQVGKIVEEFNKISRTNVKGLLESSKKSVGSLKLEWNRIYAHNKAQNILKYEKLAEKLNVTEEILCQLIADIVIVYDLWFDKEVI